MAHSSFITVRCHCKSTTAITNPGKLGCKPTGKLMGGWRHRNVNKYSLPTHWLCDVTYPYRSFLMWEKEGGNE